MKPPVVFISYTHDPQEHKDRILDLSDQLREDGVDCTIDQYEESPPEGWPKWMDRQIDDSDFVLVVCTEIYYRRVMDKVVPSVGKGIKWESTLTYQGIYDADAKNTKFIPVLLDPNDARYIPKPLKGATYYCIDTEEGYEKLYRRLTNRPSVTKPEIGKLKKLPARERKRGPVAVEVSLAKLPSTSPDLFGREKELKMLDEAWKDPGAKIVSLVAFGGVGKTALVNVWLNQMQKDNYRAAERVYGSSFYSQGAREGAHASADAFIAAALGWFGDPDPTQGSPWNKGERLAELAKRQRTLLILDGLEPLQYPPGEMAGRLRDPGLQCLLRELARQNPGLCVITTRLEVDDLKEYVGASVRQIDLKHLSQEAGMQLLRNLGTHGTDDELKQAVDEFDGHALALTLLGRYLKVVYGGDIRQRGKISKLTRERRQGGHARRVMESYEKWFKGKPEFSILRIMVLFDRPAEGGAIEAVSAKPAIEGLTSELQGLSHENWQYALSSLRDARLLAPEDPRERDTLDCHPLIREHFGEKLRQSKPDAWREAHNRLYEYYKCQSPELPDTLEEMVSLYAAVAHGCQSGQYQKALEAVYQPRILRFPGKDEFYSTYKLVAFGAELAVLSNFFDPARQQPVSELKPESAAFLMRHAGYCLQGLGRSTEAANCTQVALDVYINLKSWKDAAIAAGHLSYEHLTMGKLTDALEYAQKGVELADCSGDDFWRVARKSTLADVLHQAGRLEEAEAIFCEAERVQGERHPEHQLLYSTPGFKYCNLLLSQGRYREVKNRAEQTIQIARRNNSLIYIPLDGLSLGRSYLLQGQRKGKDNLTQAAIHLDEAVAGLRQAGLQDNLPFGLLARAELYRVLGEFKPAQRNLDEAMTIATRGEMRLQETDCHLEYARLYLVMGDMDKAQESLDTAKKMIDEMGYHRRDAEVLLTTTQLHILEGKNDDARQTLTAARTLIDEMGCHRWDIEAEVLEEQLKV